jgi:hypothetical protein
MGLDGAPYPRKRLKAQIVSFDRLDVVIPRKAPIPVHDESDMLRDGALPKGANEELSELANAPGNGRGGCEPFADPVVVE